MDNQTILEAKRKWIVFSMRCQDVTVETKTFPPKRTCDVTKEPCLPEKCPKNWRE